jgi:hypothetical protein
MGRREAAGTRCRGSCEAGAGKGEARHITALVTQKWSKARAQAHSEGRASTVAIGRSFMPFTERSECDLRGRGPLCSPQLDTRSVRAQRVSPACLRRLQSVERNAAKAASARSSRRDRARLPSGEECSGLKRRSQASGCERSEVGSARRIGRNAVLASDALPVSRLRRAGNGAERSGRAGSGRESGSVG